MSNVSLNDEAWKKLFEKYDILRQIEANGLFPISAAQIKEYREPRLMANLIFKSKKESYSIENTREIFPLLENNSQ